MPYSASQQAPSTPLEIFEKSLQGGKIKEAKRLLNALHPAEIARLLESLPPTQRKLAWELVVPENEGEVLVHLGEEVRQTLIRDMDAQKIIQATENLEVDDLADLVQELPEAVLEEVLKSMDRQRLQRLEAVLSYPEDTAGGLMDTDVVTVRGEVTLDVVLRYLRRRGALPEGTDSLFVVNRYDKYLGLLPLAALVLNDPDHTVAEVMRHDIEGIPAETSAAEVAKLFQDRDLVSAPVVDANGKLLGRITIDDVVDVIREEADHSVMGRAGLSEDEDIFAPVLPSSRRRALWLGINLLTAFLAAWVIGLFQGTIEKSVELAVLMPIVASMGGIAGSQTLTLVVRGLALEQVASGNLRWIFSKEIAVGVLNGLLWAVVVALITIIWFNNYRIAGIIALAMVLNLGVAALVGVAIPLVLKRMRIDPAIAGSVILTTFTDVIGYASFLGLATLLLFSL